MVHAYKAVSFPLTHLEPGSLCTRSVLFSCDIAELLPESLAGPLKVLTEVGLITGTELVQFFLGLRLLLEMTVDLINLAG